VARHLSSQGIDGSQRTAQSAELRAMTLEQLGELTEYCWEIRPTRIRIRA
jgi:hypothetical protein